MSEDISQLEVNAQSGDAAAQVSLGVRYYNSQGGDNDFVKAAMWFQKAAAQGNIYGQYDLGLCFLNGRGVQADAVRGAELVTQAAQKGYAQAQFYLGILFNTGHGVVQNETKAIEWYRKAAEQGHAGAQFNMGCIYGGSPGTGADVARSVHRYYRDLPNGKGGICFSVSRDVSKAVEWYRLAAKQGNAAALNNLGVLFEDGYGVGKNLGKALVLYRDAARRGNEVAKNNLVRHQAAFSRTSEDVEVLSARVRAVLEDEENGAASVECKPLMDACTPRLYADNVFRLIGLSVDAKPRDIRRRTEDLKAAEVTGEWERVHRLAMALGASPTPENVQNALQRLQDPERRFIDEFFWFWPLTAGDGRNDTALKHLQNGDVPQAYVIWCDATYSTHTEALPALHNLAVYHHLQALKGETEMLAAKQFPLSNEEIPRRIAGHWEKVIEHWESLVVDEGFWELVQARITEADEARLTDAFADRLRSTLPAAFDKINALLAVRYAEAGHYEYAQRHVRYMMQTHQGLDDVEGTLRTILAPLEKSVMLNAEESVAKARKVPEKGLSLAKELVESTREPLAVAKGLLDDGHIVRNTLFDGVAEACLNCLIAYGNKTDDWEACLPFLADALNLATTESVKARVKTNYQTAKNNHEEKKLREMCWFCKNKSAHNGSELVVNMHGDVKRDLAGGKVTWRQLDVKVPRCKTCKDAHAQHQSWRPRKAGSKAGAVIGAVVWFVGFLALLGEEVIGGALFTAWVGLLIGRAIGSIFDQTAKDRPALPQGVGRLNAGYSFPDVEKMQKLGLQLGSKPSGVT
jgi:TPR repeat protein